MSERGIRAVRMSGSEQMKHRMDGCRDCHTGLDGGVLIVAGVRIEAGC